MAPGLQEQGVGDDGADGGKRQRARNHVFRAVQQDAHHQAALGVRFNRNRRRHDGGAACRHPWKFV